MIVLQEKEQLIHIDANTELKKYQIKYALLDARLSKRYAKFYTGKYYISIAFNRDFTVQFSSNYRVDGKFNRDLQRMEDRKFMINEVTDFIYFWMNKLRKL